MLNKCLPSGFIDIIPDTDYYPLLMMGTHKPREAHSDVHAEANTDAPEIPPLPPEAQPQNIPGSSQPCTFPREPGAASYPLPQPLPALCEAAWPLCLTLCGRGLIWGRSM